MQINLEQRISNFVICVDFSPKFDSPITTNGSFKENSWSNYVWVKEIYINSIALHCTVLVTKGKKIVRQENALDARFATLQENRGGHLGPIYWGSNQGLDFASTLIEFQAVDVVVLYWQTSRKKSNGTVLGVTGLSNWDNKQQCQAQSDWCKMQMAFRSARLHCEF